MMKGFERKELPAERDYIAPDGSDVRALLALEDGGLAHFEIAPGETSVVVGPGVCITIPVETHFQFRSLFRLT
jgi:hypothetical protein